MSGPAAREVRVNEQPCRVWEAGAGDPLVVLAGLGGAPRWSRFLARLAERRRVVVPSLPGFPGARGHERLDDHLDWISATLDLLDGAGIARADLVAASVGGMLAAEVAALARERVARLVLVGPYGLFDAAEPVADVFAEPPSELPARLCADPRAFAEEIAAPEGADPVEWPIVLARASEAAARLTWPFGERGLAKRLHRIQAPTLLVWGGDDRVVPASYAKRFAAAISGPTQIRSIPGAGHLAAIDAPDALADAILAFLS
jgi:pimeloyl-ACP methyl ester carboxylesterase